MTEDGNEETDLKVVLGHQGPDHPVKPVNYGKEFAFHENSNYNEVSPHTNQNGQHQKNLQTINTGENVEKRELIQGFDPWVRNVPGREHGKPLQYSCLGNPMDRGA